jgi:hypothetical protein
MGADRTSAGEHREPVLAQAGRHVRAVHPGPQPAGGLDHDHLGQVGAVHVADGGQPAQLDDDHRAGVRDRFAGPAQALPVGQVGLRVEVGGLSQGPFQVALVTDVADVHHQGVARRGRVRAVRRPLGLPPPAESVAQADREDRVGPGGVRGRADPRRQVRVDRLGLCRMRQRGDRPAQHVVIGQSELAGRGR